MLQDIFLHTLYKVMSLKHLHVILHKDILWYYSKYPIKISKSMPKNFKTTSIKIDYLDYKIGSTKIFPHKEKFIWRLCWNMECKSILDLKT